MTRRKFIIVLAIVLLALGLWWLPRASQPELITQSTIAARTLTEQSTTQVQASSVSSTQAERLRNVSILVGKIFSSPIEFYGRVVDQNGDPVPHADVGYTAADKFMAPGTHYRGKSNIDGYFQIEGIRGAGLLVGVDKEGYYPIMGKSSADFGYGMGPDSYRRVPPTKDNPAVFVLYKMGKTEPLMRIERNALIPKDGIPITVDLASGRLSPDGNFRVEAWTEAPVEDRKFSWRCRVTVSGGGLVERKGQFDFEAPANGYEESVELGMPANAEQWTSQQQRDYFVKLPDGRFARINFTMIAGGNHYFLLESFLNPTPGSRNLEYDPKQTVKAP